jgi:hypothetical protein
MSLLLENKLLQATEASVESHLTPKNKRDYMKIVVAGLKAGLHGGPASPMAKLKESQDPIKDAAIGSVNLICLLRKQSRNTMPTNIMVPAAMTVMLHALDFVDRSGTKKIGKPELDRATHIFADIFFRNAGITPNMLKEGHDSVRKVLQNPKNVQAMKYKAGLMLRPAPMPENT